MSEVILITGPRGFVGSSLGPYLQNAGYSTLGISRNPRDNEINYGSLSEKTWNSAKAMVHLAGKAQDLKIISNDSEYFEVNSELTKKLYDQFLASDTEQFIYISSVKAVTDSVAGILSEDEIPNPVTAYGKSKRMAEAYILSNLPSDKKVYILRLCMIYGPGNKGNLNLLYQIVRNGIPWPLGAFNNQRSFCSIDNVCFVLQEILQRKNIPSGIYNIADDDALSTKELIKIIAAATKKKRCILSIPKKLITAIAHLGDIIHLPLNSERLNKLTENFVVDNTKIKKALQIEKMPITAKEGITKTIQSFNY